MIVYRILTTVLFAAVCCCLSAFGQSSECPTINVTGPEGITAPGDNFVFKLRIEPAEKAVGLSYLWRVVTINGEVGMVRGQGTTQIEVPYSDDSNVTATATVIGLPAGCPNTDAATVGVTRGPIAIRLDEIVGSLGKAPKSFFSNLNQRLVENPSALLYVIIEPGRSGSFEQKRKALVSKLGSKSSELLNRTKIVGSKKAGDRVTFWLVPAGADYPVPE